MNYVRVMEMQRILLFKNRSKGIMEPIWIKPSYNSSFSSAGYNKPCRYIVPGFIPKKALCVVGIKNKTGI